MTKKLICGCAMLFLFTLSSITLGQKLEPVCSDFDDQMLQGWTGVELVIPPFTSQPGPSGNSTDFFLAAFDGLGVLGSIDSPSTYHGDWTSVGDTGCALFSYDIRLFNDGNFGTVDISPGFVIEGAGFRAAFRVAFDINEDGGANDGWHHVEAPVSLLCDGAIPSNEFGEWEMLDGVDNSNWDLLITSVDRLAFGTNIGSFDFEQWGYDNLCLEPAECSCEQCSFESNNVLCRIIDDQLTEDFVVTGTFTNLQDIPGTHILLPPDAISPDGVELCFGGSGIPGPLGGELGTTQVLQLDMPLNNGESTEIGADLSNLGAIIIKNAMPGDEVCFRLVLLGDNGVECCTVEVCFEMPPCDCLQVDRRHDQFSEVFCSFDGGGNVFISFFYTFQLTNLFGQNVSHAFLAPLGTETFDPDYFDLDLINGGPVGHGESVELMTRIFTTNLPMGEVVNFLITIHNEDFSECCSREHSVVIPEGCVLLPETKSLPGDVNEDGVVDLTDVQPFVDLLTTGGYSVNADINLDGAVDLSDISPFVALLTGNP